jgi:hypothetical protein
MSRVQGDIGKVDFESPNLLIVQVSQEQHGKPARAIGLDAPT